MFGNDPDALWGQDWSNTMRDNVMQLWNADSGRNLLFSVHMYEVYQTAAPIVAYMQVFDDMGLPLVIGEFGPQNNGQPVDVETMFAQAQQRGNGYNGSFTVSATANSASTARSGTVTVSGGGITRPIAVTQARQSSPGGSVTAKWCGHEQQRLVRRTTTAALQYSDDHRAVDHHYRTTHHGR